MYRGKDCMKNFCEFLKEHAIKIINFKKYVFNAVGNTIFSTLEN